jgi:L-fuconolactonase
MEKRTMRVDAHQHFWRYTSAEFGWIDDSMAAIRRDFLPDDLAPQLRASGIDATVAVQARQSSEETEWLLELSRENDWIAGVVGWVPLADMSVEDTLQRIAANSKLKGVRHVLQGEPDAYMDREDFNAGVAILAQFDLTYDLLIHERQLPAAITFVDRHPQLPIVLDHLAKPLIAAQELEPWRSHIRELGRRPHLCCKLSGMVTEADFEHWTVDQLRPYVDTVLEAFGPERLMFGTDWPVCSVASSYQGWTETASTLIAELSGDERASIFGGTASVFYGLDSSSL